MKRGVRIEEPVRSLRIGEVAEMSGIGVEALRFYERSGLLSRPGRTGGGYRVYGEEVLERLAFIKQAQALGFTLDEIRQIITESEAGRAPCGRVREIVRRRLAELDERMREMRRYRKELSEALSQWDRTGDVKGHICGLIEGSHLRHGATREKKIGKR